MDTFSFFYSEGWRHISDITAYDHILFVVALTSVYALRQWRTIALLVTAFTVGHSLALAAAVYNVVSVPTALIEFLIPVTIVATCAFNIATAQRDAAHVNPSNPLPKYLLASFFGLIHGLGFSNYLKFILQAQDDLAMPLLGFNVGLEIGQLLIMLVALLLNFVVVELAQKSLRDWTLVVSGAVAGIAFVLCVETGYAFWVGE